MNKYSEDCSRSSAVILKSRFQIRLEEEILWFPSFPTSPVVNYIYIHTRTTVYTGGGVAERGGFPPNREKKMLDLTSPMRQHRGNSYSLNS